MVTTTLKDLQAAAGKAHTGGGSLLPMSDLIRLASHANHYLALFDHGKALALYHSKRLACPAQRIMLFAKDRGCTKPGCDAPAYHSQVHHVRGWAATGRTDINDLTLACGIDNRLAEKGWRTRKNARGDTEWIPQRTSIADSPAPTLTITPNDSSATATTPNPFDTLRMCTVVRPRCNR
ncbi:HNH endonuclease family protein [Mycobacterium kansasii]|uniref:HNH endonuclease family protein n=1 Tax=Mycobacterium kansasii TaxID=1768 RepID=A0A1V3WP34_MYCKA|nr:HNH endonuclease family protein [Mycobacterium kansasii]